MIRRLDGCIFTHTKRPFTAIPLHKVSALNDLYENLDYNFVGALRLVPQWRSILSRLTALVHLPD